MLWKQWRLPWWLRQWRIRWVIEKVSWRRWHLSRETSLWLICGSFWNDLLNLIVLICLADTLSSVQLHSRVRLLATPWIAARQASLSITNSGVHSDSHPLREWCHPTISSSVVPFSSCPQSLPASESFPMSQLFASGGQSTGVSALVSFLPKNTQGWSPSEWTGWISLQSKGLLRVFSNTTVPKHQFFGSQLSSQSNSHIHTMVVVHYVWSSYCILGTVLSIHVHYVIGLYNYSMSCVL